MVESVFEKFFVEGRSGEGGHGRMEVAGGGVCHIVPDILDYMRAGDVPLGSVLGDVDGLLWDHIASEAFMEGGSFYQANGLQDIKRICMKAVEAVCLCAKEYHRCGRWSELSDVALVLLKRIDVALLSIDKVRAEMIPVHAAIIDALDNEGEFAFDEKLTSYVNSYRRAGEMPGVFNDYFMKALERLDPVLADAWVGAGYVPHDDWFAGDDYVIERNFTSSFGERGVESVDWLIGWACELWRVDRFDSTVFLKWTNERFVVTPSSIFRHWIKRHIIAEEMKKRVSIPNLSMFLLFGGGKFDTLTKASTPFSIVKQFYELQLVCFHIEVDGRERVMEMLDLITFHDFNLEAEWKRDHAKTGYIKFHSEWQMRTNTSMFGKTLHYMRTAKVHDVISNRCQSVTGVRYQTVANYYLLAGNYGTWHKLVKRCGSISWLESLMLAVVHDDVDAFLVAMCCEWGWERLSMHTIELYHRRKCFRELSCYDDKPILSTKQRKRNARLGRMFITKRFGRLGNLHRMACAIHSNVGHKDWFFTVLSELDTMAVPGSKVRMLLNISN